MEEKRVIKIDVIQDNDAVIFTQKVNARTSELQNVLELTFPEGKGFCALIKYEDVEKVPENAKDRYYQQHGKHYMCNDCPFLVLDPDRRAVSHWCELHKDRTELKIPCCNDFYEGLLSGLYHLVTPEERKRQFLEMDKQELERRKEYAKINQKISYEKRTAAKYEREAAMKKPRYCFEFIKARTDKLKSIDMKYLLPEEIAYIIYGKIVDLSERTLIEIAKDNQAAVLWKTSSVFDGAVSVIYKDEAVD